MKGDGFKRAKKRSRRYPAQSILDANYADDIAFLENSPVQAESVAHSLLRAAGGIDFHVNADKTIYVI